MLCAEEGNHRPPHPGKPTSAGCSLIVCGIYLLRLSERENLVTGGRSPWVWRFTSQAGNGSR